MHYVKDTETVSDDSLSEISQIFCFNWTATHFYSELIKNKLSKNKSAKLTCLGRFDKPFNNRTCNYFDIVYKQWLEYSVNFIKRLRILTIKKYYTKNKHSGTVLEPEEMVAYKTKVCKKFNKAKTEGTSRIVLDIPSNSSSGSVSDITTGSSSESAPFVTTGSSSGIQQQNRLSVIQSTSSVYQAGGRSASSRLPLKKRPLKQDETPVKKQAMTQDVIVLESSEIEEEKND